MYSYKKKSLLYDNLPAFRKLFIRLTVSLVLGIVLSFVFKSYIIFAWKFNTDSMRPGLVRGKTGFWNRMFSREKMNYGKVYLYKIQNAELVLPGRLAGKPGDVLEIKSKKLRRNGEAVEDKSAFFSDPRPAFPQNISSRDFTEKISLGQNEFFFLCDNRDECMDSRTVGKVQKSDILGELIF